MLFRSVSMLADRIHYITAVSELTGKVNLNTDYAMTSIKPKKLNGTHLIHGDSSIQTPGGEVAPSISVSTSTFVELS